MRARRDIFLKPVCEPRAASLLGTSPGAARRYAEAAGHNAARRCFRFGGHSTGICSPGRIRENGHASANVTDTFRQNHGSER